MGLYALFRLLWRPLNVLFVVSVGILTAMFIDTEGSLSGAPRLGRLNLFTLIFSGFTGIQIGTTIREIQHTLLAWTLPSLRRKLFASLLLTGVINAFVATWIYDGLGGPAPWLPTFTSSLMWFSIAVVCGTSQVLGTPSRRIRLFGVTLFTVFVLVVAGFSIDKIVEFCSKQPILSVFLAILGIVLCLHRTLGAKAARENSLVPEVAFALRKQRYIERNGPAGSEKIMRRWHRTAPPVGLLAWIRTIEYENYHFVRGGLPAKASMMVVTAAVAVACLAWVTGKNELVSVVPAGVALCYCLGGSYTLGDGLLYPLSRKQRSKLEYWAGLLYNAFISAIMLLSFFLLNSLIELYANYDFLRPIALVFTVSPAIQWIHLRREKSDWMSFAMLLIAVSAIPLSVLWVIADPDIPAIHQLAACASLIFITQLILRYRIGIYFKKGDFV